MGCVARCLHDNLVVAHLATGFSLAFGVIQEYYVEHPEKLTGSRSAVATIGTTATGILYLCTPITFAILARWPQLRAYCGPLGLCIMAFSFVASAFTTVVWHLLLLQGMLSALGSGLLFTAPIAYLDEWFVSRKGLAYGVMGAAKGITGMLVPLLIDRGLREYGAQTTLIIWAVASLALTAPALCYLRPRVPAWRKPSDDGRSNHHHHQQQQQAQAEKSSNTTVFLRSPLFWLFQAANVLEALGFFLPFAYLSSYAVSIRLPSSTGTLLLAALNGSSIFGCVAIGMLNDAVDVWLALAFSSLGAGLAVLVFWGAASGAGMLALFAVGYGFFAGGYSSAWAGVMSKVKGRFPETDTGLVYGLLAGGRGVGNLVSGPLSILLVTGRKDWVHDGERFGYGGEYGMMIAFTGVTALLGGSAVAWRCLRRG